MKFFFLAVFLIISPIFLGQKPIQLKKKFFGTYKGQITSFQLDSGKELVDVDSTEITISILDSVVSIRIGKNSLVGKYKVLFEAKSYYLLDCVMEGQLAGERIVVYKRGKKVSRDGLYPQPSAMLYRMAD